METKIRLVCIKERNKLRVRVRSPGYSSEANCQFPRNIRQEGAEYLVSPENVILAFARGKYFYRVTRGIEIVQPNAINSHSAGNNAIVNNNSVNDDVKIEAIYGEQANMECCICMSSASENPEITFVIFANCGHYVCCDACAYNCKVCPICRANIVKIITRDELQL